MEIVINTYGTSVNRDNEGFVISTPDGRQRVPVDGVTALRVTNGAQLTSDAIMLAIEKEIEIIFMTRHGDTLGRVWSPKYGSISTIRKGQLAFTYSIGALEWIKQVLSKKIDNQQALLLMMEKHTTEEERYAETVMRKLDKCRQRVEGVKAETLRDAFPTLRGIEGTASRLYFEGMNMFIPPKYRFEQRSQHPARDVANALLNYGYGMLYSKVESCLIRAGIDPYIGVMHRDNYNRPVLVYDVIEVFRCWVDYVVYSLLAQDAVTEDYYSTRPDGSCWLEGLGRRVIIQSLNDYMEAGDTGGVVARSRATQIFLYAQRLAQLFKKYQNSINPES